MRAMTNLLTPIAAILIFAGCAQAPPTAPVDNSAAAEQGIREAVDASLKVMQTKDVDKFVDGFYSDDASVFMPGAPALTGRDSIRVAMKGAFSDPNLTMTLVTTKVVASKSGEMGYAEGTVVQTTTNPKTKKVTEEHDKWVTVFRKQADGSWKAVSDIFNASPAPAPAPMMMMKKQ